MMPLLYLYDIRTKKPTTMLAVRLDPQIEEELEQLAAATGRSKSFYVKEALAASEAKPFPQADLANIHTNSTSSNQSKN